MDQSGNEKEQSFFPDPAPESGRSGRQARTEPAVPQPGGSVPPEMSAAELRLYAWSELSERHRNEVCRQIRMRCETFIATMRVDRGQRKSEVNRLFSEVVAHLLRATSVRREDATTSRDRGASMGANDRSDAAPPARGPVSPPWLTKGRVDPWEPMRDARVIWVVEETCNRQALFHRYEDMRRRDRGGKWHGSGYPLVTVDEQTIEHLGGHYDPTESESDTLQMEESMLAWQGLTALVAHRFGGSDDVAVLVQVLAQDRETQDAFGSQWPIGRIAQALNARQPDQVWDDDRVENAKRRLTKFVAKIKQTHGLDAIDLRALLVRYARERQSNEGQHRRIA